MAPNPPITSRLSQSPSLRFTASVIGTMLIVSGINDILSHLSTLSFFGLQPSHPASSTKACDNVKPFTDSLMITYGARDVFMGLTIYAAAYFGNGDNNKQNQKNKALGWILIAGSGVAFLDGAVCKGLVGKGEWKFWSYASILAAVGLALLGVLDGGA